MVESALVLPLTVFLVLGSLQLFLVLQARLMAEHAAFRAVRTGSLSQGNCQRMLQSAIFTLLPTLEPTKDATRVVAAFNARKDNLYNPGRDGGHNGDIVWLLRPSPDRATINQHADYRSFDDPDSPLVRLQLRLIYWFPLRIPFANWVMARIALANLGIQSYNAYDPLSPTGKGDAWTAGSAFRLSSATYEGIPNTIPGELLARTNSPAGTYVMPIEATAAMRMMTPPRRGPGYFTPQNCRTP